MASESVENGKIKPAFLMLYTVLSLLILVAVRGLLLKGVNAMLEDDSFSLRSNLAIAAHKIATDLSVWLTKHPAKASEFETKLVAELCSCMQSRARSQKVRRERMWTAYHQLRSSDTYVTDWQAFLYESIKADMSPIFCQYVGHYVFKELIKLHHPLDPLPAVAVEPLIHAETCALRYAAGCVPRMLRKKLKKSTHPLREDILLCLLDLLDDGDEESGESAEWIQLINRGGLTLANNTTFEVFVAMEYELRKHIRQGGTHDLDKITSEVRDNEDVQFLWSIVSADWEEQSAAELLQMIVNHWVRIRGFSYASAWLEKFKTAQKKTTQKSKGIRKHLTSKPTKAGESKATPCSGSDSDEDKS